jgi:hypothetical protein
LGSPWRIVAGHGLGAKAAKRHTVVGLTVRTWMAQGSATEVATLGASLGTWLDGLDVGSLDL